MKALVLGFSLLLSVAGRPALALPVLNANAPGAQSEILYPDHLDKNLFYVHPSVMLVSKDENGQPNLSYLEYRDQKGKHGVLQTTMVLEFSDPRIAQAKAEVLKVNSQARFSAVPMENTSVLFANTLKPMIENSACEHPAGTLSEEQSCVFQWNYRGTLVLAKMLRQGLTLTTQFRYDLGGVMQEPNGSYSNEKVTFQVAGRIGSAELKKYPELFHDENGRPLRGIFVFEEDPSFPL